MHLIDTLLSGSGALHTGLVGCKFASCAMQLFAHSLSLNCLLVNRPTVISQPQAWGQRCLES